MLDLEVLETRPASAEYPWAFRPCGDYRRHALQGAPGPELDPPGAALDRQLSALLDQRQPDVVLTVGWADRAYRRLLRPGPAAPPAGGADRRQPLARRAAPAPE